jgi:hypothetical protein
MMTDDDGTGASVVSDAFYAFKCSKKINFQI